MRRRGVERAVVGCALVAGWLSGCGPLVLPEGETEAGSESEAPTTTSPVPPPPGTTTTMPPPPPGTTTTPPPPPDSTTGVSSVSFFDGFDDGWSPECDLFAQDCPRGEKCMPWANDGGNIWNALRCSPIASDPDAVGEACVVEGSAVSGVDSCEAGSMCWDVDPATHEGVCVAFCVGSEADPSCVDPTTTCVMSGSGVLALCIPNCDPLLQDCAEGHACYFAFDAFLCVPDASRGLGAPGDPCEFINACDPGTFCAAAELVPDCAEAVGCCSPFCDVTSDDPWYCLPGQDCVPWWQDAAPPGYAHVGACVLP
jgi:hypothetical protein